MGELLGKLHEAGVVPDPSAGRAFRHAAAAMARAADDEARRGWARQAAEALVALAAAGADAELRALLTPDPATDDVTWTVACYQIGDLTPSAVRDFAEPSPAVATLAACPDANHVAAELVASTSHGLRWSALSRTNTVREFKLPDAETASDASHVHGTELAAALRHWRQQLARWSDGVGLDASPPPAPPARPASAPAAPAATAPVAQPRPASPSVAAAGDARGRSRIEATLAELAAAVAGLAARLDAIDERLDDLARDVARHGSAAEVAAERAHRQVASVAASVRSGHDATWARVRSSEEHLARLVAGLTAEVAGREAQLEDRLGTLERRLGLALAETARHTGTRLREVAAAVDRLGERPATAGAHPVDRLFTPPE